VKAGPSWAQATAESRAAVIFFDPIFQGLAISFMAGASR
jgi:hypothetical protein